ncbi:MAG: efflux RND transporter periplasmic adaptor subunit [Rubricella sp.]
MRIASIITALVICALVYGFVIERETFIALVGGGQGDGSIDAVLDDEAPQPDTVTTMNAVPVVAMRSSARQIESTITLRGRAEPVREVEVRAETTGRVLSDPLPRGTRVAEGDILCRLDPGIRPAQLAEAEARLAEARLNAEASRSLQERGFSSETEVAQRTAQLQAAQAQVDQAETELERLAIRAPFAGTLDEEPAETGTLLQAGALCARLLDLSRVTLVGFAPEASVTRLEPGLLADARLIDGRTLQGTVTHVASSADEATRTFEVNVEVDNTDGLIRGGATVELSIALEGEPAHFLPQAALTLDDAGRLGVRVAEEGVARFHAVSILRDESDGVWLSGLPPQADVIVVGQDFVSDGGAVSVTYAEDQMQ